MRARNPLLAAERAAAAAPVSGYTKPSRISSALYPGVLQAAPPVLTSPLPAGLAQPAATITAAVMADSVTGHRTARRVRRDRASATCGGPPAWPPRAPRLRRRRNGASSIYIVPIAIRV